MNAVTYVLNNKFLATIASAFILFGIVSFGIDFIYLIVILVASSIFLPFVIRVMWHLCKIGFVFIFVIGGTFAIIGLILMISEASM